MPGSNRWKCGYRQTKQTFAKVHFQRYFWREHFQGTETEWFLFPLSILWQVKIMKEINDKWRSLGRIGFVGAGKVGFTLGQYFKAHGVTVSGYYSRHLASAQEAAELTSSTAFSSLEEVARGSDTLFVTVPDGQISSVWDYMRAMQADLSGKIVCHASGSLSSDIFSGSRERKVSAFSVHPLFAISDKYHSYKQLSQSLFTIEGEALEAREQLSSLLKHCGNEVEMIAADKKALYHAAAVVVSNFTVGLSYLGSEMLKSCGFTQENADKALLPLMQGSVDNMARQGSIMALTGPVERGDQETVRRHLQVLETESEKVVYESMTKVLEEIASKKRELCEWET